MSNHERPSKIPDNSPVSHGKGFLILLVGDSPELDTLHELLSDGDGISFPCDVRQFSSASSAVEHLQSNQVDCIVSEYEFPEVDGLEFLDTVREDHPFIPFVLWPENGSESIASKAVSAGVTEYICRSDETGSSLETVRRKLTDVLSRYSFQYQEPTDFREYERRLERQRFLFEQAQEIAGVFVFELYPDSETIHCSDGVHDVFGDGVGYEVSIREAVEMFHPDDQDQVEKEFQNAVVNQTPFEMEGRVIRSDDELRYVFLRSYVITGGDGDTELIRGICQDITASREHEKYLQQAQQLADMGTFQGDPMTGNIWWSEGVYSIFDMDPQQDPLSTDEYLERTHPDDREEVSSFYDGAIEETTFEGENRIVTNGSVKWVRVMGEVLSVQNGNITVVGTIQDVTEQKNRELKLETARERYRSVIEAAPDPIFITELESGEIVEANTAAKRFYGGDSEELIGTEFTTLYPAGRTSELSQLYPADREVNNVRELDDGSPVSLRRSDGEKVQVAVSAETVPFEDEVLVVGIFRDISDQFQYERSLEAVNDVARSSLQAETPPEIAHIVSQRGEKIVDYIGPMVYLYDDEKGELYPSAYPEDFAEKHEMPRHEPGDSIAWRVFDNQRMEIIEDVRQDPDVYNPETPARSGMYVPLGDHGVLIVYDTERGSFDDISIEITQTLAATAETALDRVVQLQELRDREKKSKEQARKLERLNQLNEEIRVINQTILQAESHDVIDQSVCDSIVSLERFDFAWVAEPDYAEDKLAVKAHSEQHSQYLEEVPLTLDSETCTPAVRAARNRKPVFEPNIPAGLQEGEWQSTALVHDFRGSVSVPLIYDGVLHGVLTVCSEEVKQFDEKTQEVLTEMGQMIGFAHHTVTQQNALVTGDTVDLVFEIDRPDDPIAKLASVLDSEVNVENIISRTDDTYLVYFTVDACQDPDSILEDITEISLFEQSRLVSESESPMIEAVAYRDSILFDIVNLGAELRSATSRSGNLTISLSVPKGDDVQSFVDRVRNRYPEITLKAQKESVQESSAASISSPLENITERQREILDAGYYSGYFDEPRSSTGTEIADSLDISHAGFSKQQRRAIKKILDVLYD